MYLIQLLQSNLLHFYINLTGPAASHVGLHQPLPVPRADPAMGSTSSRIVLDLVRCVARHNDFDGLLYERPTQVTDELHFPGSLYLRPVLHHGNGRQSLQLG